MVEKKYDYEDCGIRSLDASRSIGNMICHEFERNVGKFQSYIGDNKLADNLGHYILYHKQDDPHLKLVAELQKILAENPNLEYISTDGHKLKLADLFQRELPSEMKAMLIQFNDNTEHPDDVHSYRYYQLLLFADSNYVAVLTRKKWVALKKEHCEIDEDGDVAYEDDGVPVIKEDCDYEEGVTPWKCVSYHDSCWRSSVDDFLIFTPHLGSLKSLGLSHWYSLVTVTKNDEIWKTIRNRDDFKPWHFDEDHNYIGKREGD